MHRTERAVRSAVPLQFQDSALRATPVVFGALRHISNSCVLGLYVLDLRFSLFQGLFQTAVSPFSGRFPSPRLVPCHPAYVRGQHQMAGVRGNLEIFPPFKLRLAGPKDSNMMKEDQTYFSY